jgi:predicted RNA-binding Zn-ribbon protein involved in translation (DUF1610 family)
MDDQKLRTLLLRIYVNHLWDQNKSGQLFACADADLRNELSSSFAEMKAQGDTVIETIGENDHIVWTVAMSLVDESDRNVQLVLGRRLLVAEPSLIKLYGQTEFELRGRRKNLKIIQERLQKTKTIRVVRPQKMAKPLVEAFSTVLDGKSRFFEMVGIRYLESNLPNKSKLAIRNDKGIAEDVRELARNKSIVPSAFTDIEAIELKIGRIGKSVKLKIHHHDDGFSFEVDDKKMLESERRDVKRMLESIGIGFDKTYDYAVQYDTRFIFHKILDGNLRVYDKYFGSMEGRSREVLNDVLEVTTKDIAKCQSCDRESTDKALCPHCGSTKIRTSQTREMSIREARLLELFAQRVAAATKHLSSKYSLAKVETTELSGKTLLRLSLTKIEVADKASFSRHYDFYLCPLGQGRLPRRINEYLLDSVLILYGNGFLRRTDYSKFGLIDAYQLLLAEPEENAKVLEEAVDIAIRLNEDRIVSSAASAQRRLEWVTLPQGLKEDYTPKDFERDIFFLLKRMFPHTERWGREGQRESDGIIAFSAEGNTYFVASYDPKLTHDEKGYDLTAEQQNKAAYYILSENLNEKVRLLTEDKGINGHLIISNAFKTSSVPSFGAGVSSWVHLLDAGESNLAGIPVILLPLEELLTLSELFNEHWDLIKGNAQFHRKLLDYVTNMFRTDQHCLLITRQHLETLKESIIELKRTTKLTEPILFL